MESGGTARVVGSLFSFFSRIFEVSEEAGFGRRRMNHTTAARTSASPPAAAPTIVPRPPEFDALLVASPSGADNAPTVAVTVGALTLDDDDPETEGKGACDAPFFEVVAGVDSDGVAAAATADGEDERVA